MHKDHDKFISAIHGRRKMRVKFYSKEDQAILTRICAPLDYGPSRRAKVKNNRYHFWDYTSDEKEHVLSLNPNQILEMEILDETFDPAEFVTWDTRKNPWFVPRDWGPYS